MRYVWTFLFVLIPCLVLSSASCASSDLSGMTYDELENLHWRASMAVYGTDEWTSFLLPPGVYKIGIDIPEGKWTFALSNGDRATIDYRPTQPQEPSYVYETLKNPYYSSFDDNYDVSSISLPLKRNAYLAIDQSTVQVTSYEGPEMFKFSTVSSFDNAARFDFDKISASPDDYAGVSCAVEGKVLQSLGSRSDTFTLRLSVNVLNTDIILVFIPHESVPDFNIIANDKILVTGTIEGEYTYESVSGDDITLPLILASKIELLGP